MIGGVSLAYNDVKGQTLSLFQQVFIWQEQGQVLEMAGGHCLLIWDSSDAGIKATNAPPVSSPFWEFQTYKENAEEDSLWNRTIWT